MYLTRSHAFITAALCALSLSAAAAPPAEPGNGQLHTEDGVTRAWSAQSQQWLGVEEFWLEYAPTAAGRFWGQRGDYPSYADAGEHDTLLIELEQGPCLMYFFHERWRRAQDVRRWDEGFNAQLGCPHVFD